MSALKISLVQNATDTTTRDLSAAGIITFGIRGGRWRQQVERIRGARNREQINSLKKQLPAVIWSGVFSRRANDALTQHSGLLCADLDSLGEKLPEIREKLLKSPHLWALFVSPGGRGLKAVFRVPRDTSKHAASFRAVERHVLELTGVHIDQACKDVARLCFVSYDPDAFLNVNTCEITPIVQEPLRRKRFVTTGACGPDPDMRQRIAAELLGEIRWDSKTHGFCTCPGKHLHTTGDGDRDCELHLDDVPTLHCFHDHCRAIVDAVNRELRSRIGKAEFIPTPRVVAQPANSGSFPLHCLPGACEAMARAICETVRVLESLPGCCALGFLSAAIGAGLQVRSDANRVTRGNLYILPSAESGSGKERNVPAPCKAFLGT